MTYSLSTEIKTDLKTLADFGWNSHFNAQIIGGTDGLVPAKVTEVHRGYIRVAAPGVNALVPAFHTELAGEETAATVGDWVLLDPATGHPCRLLDRSSLFKRRAPGTDRKYQLIAANIDTLFIVSSCNADFNVARLERYLALASEAGVMPVLVLTKADLSDDADSYVREAAKLLAGLMVELVDARDAESVAALADWCKAGQSAALVGSSGVGKSTLINTLTGGDDVATQGIREDDAKGRHTTTGRAFYKLPSGGWLLDTPGMRGLEVTDASEGVDEVFADITALAASCKFGDCQHASEPGCAVTAAISAGDLDADRLKRWNKLINEEAHSTASMAQRHAKDRAFGKLIKKSLKDKKRFRGG
jgi:ribosome biogenesis GTPase